jgi:hypothetical protein
LRLAGTGLTYAPAAIALVGQLGSGGSPLYPFAFALACLAGIAVGMWCHVRAYLGLGLAFLLLDLVTLLVRASVRDQRFGFFLLSFTGLAILATMVGYTMRKEAILATLRRLRRALATWQ